MTAATRAGPQVRSDKSISTENSPVPFKINSNSAVVRASVDANPDVYIYRRYGGVCGAGNMTQSGYRPENADYIEKLTKVINGRRIGRDPFTISLDTLAAAGHGPRRTSQIVAAFGDVPLVDGIRRHKDLRRQCHACAENLAEVRRCAVIDCPIWPYRLGRNPHNPRRGTNPFAPRSKGRSSNVDLSQGEVGARSKVSSPGTAELRPKESGTSGKGDRKVKFGGAFPLNSRDDPS